MLFYKHYKYSKLATIISIFGGVFYLFGGIFILGPILSPEEFQAGTQEIILFIIFGVIQFVVGFFINKVAGKMAIKQYKKKILQRNIKL